MNKKTNGEEPSKIFVGGLTRNTTKEMLEAEFNNYGEIVDSIVVKNLETGISRGFGFITFKDPNSAQLCLKNQIKVDGKIVDVKICNTKLAAQQRYLKNSSDACKLFIGGLPHNVSDDEIKQFFQRYGPVKEFKMMYDDIKKRPRGFGFITFESEESASQLLMEHYVTFKGKQIEIKPQVHNLKQQNQSSNAGAYQTNYDLWNLAAAAAAAAAGTIPPGGAGWPAPAGSNWNAQPPYNYAAYGNQGAQQQNWNYNYYGQTQGYYSAQPDNAAAGMHDQHAYYAASNPSLLPAPIPGGTGATAVQQAKSYTNYNNPSQNAYQQNQPGQSGTQRSSYKGNYMQNSNGNMMGNTNVNPNDSYQSNRQAQVSGYHPYRR